MDNLTLAACSYNTPLVTLTMLRSFFTHHKPTKVLICDNSTNNDTSDLLTKENVKFLKTLNGLHSPSVDVLIKECTTKYMLLVDTDVVFLKNHESIFDRFKTLDLTLMGEICGDRGGKQLHNRVHPWHCFIDTETIKSHGINFFDPTRLSNKDGKRIYDVGASFFEDIKNAKLRIGNANFHDTFYRHFEGMSWRVNKYGKADGNIDVDTNATHNNKELYKYGLLVERMYQNEIEKYKNTAIVAL